jgi:hypothetical protein
MRSAAAEDTAVGTALQREAGAARNSPTPSPSASAEVEDLVYRQRCKVYAHRRHIIGEHAGAMSRTRCTIM